jgi:3-hydroxybutyryl-CoA dehydrogenase
VRVLVLGAGLMGAQIGCEYVAGGHDVTFVARDGEAAAARVAKASALAGRLGLDLQGSYEISAVPDEAADLVVESLPEDLELKARLLAPLADTPVIATNTSSLSITELGERIGASERTVGTHYLNPPLLMPPVEVVAGLRTDPAVVERMASTLSELGKLPVLVERDVPGFVWNRLQLALVREALWLVEHGVASPETVDTVVREGLARRWRHVGPFAIAALGGVETWLRIGENLLPELSTAADLAGLDRHVALDDPEAAAAVRDEALLGELYRERGRARSTTRPS